MAPRPPNPVDACCPNDEAPSDGGTGRRVLARVRTSAVVGRSRGKSRTQAAAEGRGTKAERARGLRLRATEGVARRRSKAARLAEPCGGSMGTKRRGMRRGKRGVRRGREGKGRRREGGETGEGGRAGREGGREGKGRGRKRDGNTSALTTSASECVPPERPPVFPKPGVAAGAPKDGAVEPNPLYMAYQKRRKGRETGGRTPREGRETGGRTPREGQENG